MARLMGLVTPLAHLISLQLFFFGVKNLAGTGHLVACKTLVSYLLEKKTHHNSPFIVGTVFIMFHNVSQCFIMFPGDIFPSTH